MTIRTYRYRFDFDYRNVRKKLQKGHKHRYRFEDIWADCRDEEAIRKIDYCRLTVQQIIDLGVVDLPEDFTDPGDIMNAAYDEQEIAKKPLLAIQWSKKESVSIRERLAPILSNIAEWLHKHDFEMKTFRTNSEGEGFEVEADRQQELHMKDKSVAIPTSSRRGPRIKFTVSKKDTRAIPEGETIESEPSHSKGKGVVFEEIDSDEEGIPVINPLKKKIQQKQTLMRKKIPKMNKSLKVIKKVNQSQKNKRMINRNPGMMKKELSPPENVVEELPRRSSPVTSNVPHTPPNPNTPPPVPTSPIPTSAIPTVDISPTLATSTILDTPSVTSIHTIDILSSPPSSIPSLSSSSYDITSETDFNRFMNESMCDQLNVQTIGAVMIDTMPIVTIPVVTSEVTLTTELTVNPEAHTSSLPHWLISQVSKRKKQMISPEELDLRRDSPSKS